MSIFNEVDFSKAHDKVTCCILHHLIQGVQHLKQEVSFILYNSDGNH